MAEGLSSQAGDRAGRSSRTGSTSSDALDENKDTTTSKAVEVNEKGVSEEGTGTGKGEVGAADNDDEEYDGDEPPEDDDMPPLAEEPSAGLQAIEIQRMHTQSRVTSTQSRSPTVVPRSKRRGLFGRLAVLPEVERPLEYPRKTKWLITLVIALSAACGPMGSSIFYRE